MSSLYWAVVEAVALLSFDHAVSGAWCESEAMLHACRAPPCCDGRMRRMAPGSLCGAALQPYLSPLASLP